MRGIVAAMALLTALHGGCSSDGSGSDDAATPPDATAADLALGGAGAACVHGSDCQSGVCTNNTCTAPTSGCTDGKQDGDETDVDCGGTCGKCAVGKKCLHASDCATALCTNNVCTAPAPTCTDGTKNGNETDIDCGGGTCPKCADGKACSAPSDCAGGACTGGVCKTPMASCSDGKKNGAETDVDCGGGTCPACALGKACATASDCASGYCANQVCAPPQPLSLAFAAPVAYPTAGQTWRAVATDVNADGILDLVGACLSGCFNNATVSVLLGNGDGTFKPFVGAGGSGHSAGFTVGDFDGDHVVDIVACDYTPTAWFLRGKGNGSFATQSAIPLGGANCASVVGLDVDRNGKLDIAVLQTNGISGGTATTFLGNGDGTFTVGSSIAFPSTLGYPATLATGDLDGDGHLDVLAGINYTFSGTSYVGTIVALLGRPTGLVQVSKSSFQSSVWDIATADVNGDGIADVIAGGVGATMANVFIGGMGGGALSSTPVPFTGTYGGHLADFDHDGKLDAAAVGPQGSVLVERGDGSGDFATGFMIAVSGAPVELVSADFDRDGKPDIAVFDSMAGGVSIILNRSK